MMTSFENKAYSIFWELIKKEYDGHITPKNLKKVMSMVKEWMEEYDKEEFAYNYWCNKQEKDDKIRTEVNETYEAMMADSGGKKNG